MIEYSRESFNTWSLLKMKLEWITFSSRMKNIFLFNWFLKHIYKITSRYNLIFCFVYAKNNFFLTPFRFEIIISLESALQIVYNWYVLNFNKLLNVEKILIWIKKKCRQWNKYLVNNYAISNLKYSRYLISFFSIRNMSF